jgi:hypothetical protein
MTRRIKGSLTDAPGYLPTRSSSALTPFVPENVVLDEYTFSLGAHRPARGQPPRKARSVASCT